MEKEERGGEELKWGWETKWPKSTRRKK